MASLRFTSVINSLKNRISQTTALSTSSRSVVNTQRLQPVCRYTTRQYRKFHNGPPRNPWGENPLPMNQQYLIFGSGVAAFIASCFFAYATDLFKFKFGEIDWEMIRAEKLAALQEGAEEEEEEGDEEGVAVATVEEVAEDSVVVDETVISDISSSEDSSVQLIEEPPVVSEIVSEKPEEEASFDIITSGEAKEAEAKTKNVSEEQVISPPSDRIEIPVVAKSNEAFVQSIRSKAVAIDKATDVAKSIVSTVKTDLKKVEEGLEFGKKKVDSVIKAARKVEDHIIVLGPAASVVEEGALVAKVELQVAGEVTKLVEGAVDVLDEAVDTTKKMSEHVTSVAEHMIAEPDNVSSRASQDANVSSGASQDIKTSEEITSKASEESEVTQQLVHESPQLSCEEIPEKHATGTGEPNVLTEEVLLAGKTEGVTLPVSGA